MLSGVTRTPKDPTTGVGDCAEEGLGEAPPGGDPVEDGLACGETADTAGEGEREPAVLELEQATAAAATAARIAMARWALILKRSLGQFNSTLRRRLRFRYDPRSEAGLRPSPSGLRPNGYVRRTAIAVRFVLCDWRNKATLNLTEVASHLV